MYPILDTRVKCKLLIFIALYKAPVGFNRSIMGLRYNRDTEKKA